MKKVVLYFSLVLLSTLALAGCKSSSTAKQVNNEYTDAIEQGQFTFTARHVSPARGPSRYLTSDYTVKLSGDTLDVYLPYFGRAYSAPMNPTEGGFKFVSTDFDYQVTAKKNGTYNITITPNDITNSDIRGTVLRLDLGNSGYGSLNVRSNNRESINFTGIFE